MALSVKTVVACDDIRQELNGKYILIGVYVGTILVTELPARVQMAWWIVAHPTKTGEHTLTVRLTGEKSGRLFEGVLKLDVVRPEDTGIALPPVPVLLKEEEDIVLTWKLHGSERWQKLHQMSVRLVPALLPAEHMEAAV